MRKLLLFAVTFVAFAFVSISIIPVAVNADELKELELKLKLLNEQKQRLQKKKMDNMSGPWEAHFNSGNDACSALNAKNISIDHGKASVSVSHPQDGPFDFEAAVFDDGKFKGFASGSYATINFTGYFDGNSGELKARLTGEVDCSATWMLTKK